MSTPQMPGPNFDWKREAEQYRNECDELRNLLRRVEISSERESVKNIRLREALKRLAAEASGFLSMADKSIHGVTNMRCLEMRIAEARQALGEEKP